MQPAPFCPFDICSSMLQSKEIGLQMHEELLKVTNELYTVSLTPVPLLFGIEPPLLLCPALEGGWPGGWPGVWGHPGPFCSVLCPRDSRIIRVADNGSQPHFCFRISGEGPWAHLVCKSS